MTTMTYAAAQANLVAALKERDVAEDRYLQAERDFSAHFTPKRREEFQAAEIAALVAVDRVVAAPAACCEAKEAERKRQQCDEVEDLWVMMARERARHSQCQELRRNVRSSARADRPSSRR